MDRLAATKSDIINNLRKEIVSLQSHKKVFGDSQPNAALGPVAPAFSDGIFPLGAIHEFISREPEQAAATTGFISALTSGLLQKDGIALWISTRRTLFPPALKAFGIKPQRIIFIDLANYKECLWSIEEALKCDAVGVVIGELGELSFAESRRLQLAVEKSHVTGFIHRYNPKAENPVACVTRWKISPIPSEANTTLPGLSRPRWHVDLVKVRSGYPGSWDIEWFKKSFREIPEGLTEAPKILKLKTG